MIGIIYIVTNTKNSKVYIGKTVKTLKERSYQHIYNAVALRKSYRLYRAIRKYGVDNFSFNILETVDKPSIEDLNISLFEKEKLYVELYDSYKTGYNMTPGGDGSSFPGFTKRQLRKMSKIHKERCANSQDVEYLKKLGKEYADRIKRPVYQLSMENGEIIAKFSWSGEAESVTKIKKSTICLCALGKRRMAGGFLWAYDENKHERFDMFLKSAPLVKGVYQIDAKTGSVVCEYASVRDAKTKTGYHSIVIATLDRPYRCNGFLWVNNLELSDEILKKSFNRVEGYGKSKKPALCRPVRKVDNITRKELATFNSITDASLDTGDSFSSIVAQAGGRIKKIRKAYTWEYI